MPWPDMGDAAEWGPVEPPVEPVAQAQPPIAGAQSVEETDADRNLAAGLPSDIVWGWFPTRDEDAGPNPQGAGWKP